MTQVEFQAVILAAGKGSRMPELTTGKPKCLLPVGTKPLVWYPLHKLQLSGFTDVMMIVQENQKSEIQSVLEATGLEIRIDYCTVNGNEDLGTADSLRLIHEKLKSDVLVVSCDLITDVNFKELLNVFRRHNASVASLLFHPQARESISLPGPQYKYKPERDLIGIDAQTNRLIFLASVSDFEHGLGLPLSFLRKHTHIKMHSNLIDCHVYVLKNWIIKYLQNEPNISTIKGELLPHIIKKQLSKPAKATDSDKSGSSGVHDIFYYAKEDPVDLQIRDSSSYNDHYGDVKPTYHGDSIRCYAHIANPNDFGIRINNLPDYWLINNRIKENWENITDGHELCMVDSGAEIKSSQVDEKCVIWKGCKLHERTSFKNSNIGANTVVNSYSRVFNSVVMTGVTIKEKVALENCIVCDGAIVETGCQIKNCVIGSHHTVPEKSDHVNEMLTESDRLMEI